MVFTKNTNYGILADGSRIFFALSEIFFLTRVETVCDGCFVIRPNGDSMVYKFSALVIEEDINDWIYDIGLPKVAKIFTNIGCFNP